MKDRAVPTVLVDNERTRVTEWRFAPGAAIGWHVHEYDYLVVPMLDGKLAIEDEKGKRSFSELKAHQPYFPPGRCCARCY